MSGIRAEAFLAACVIWAAIMLPSSAFGYFDEAATETAKACAMTPVLAVATPDLARPV